MAVILLWGGALDDSRVPPFCVYMDMNMDTDKKKPNKIRAFASMSMGSSPTAGINWGSVENSAFPRFLLILCGFQSFKGFKIPNG